MNRRFGAWALLLAAALGGAAPVAAQQGTGQVVGRVLDAATGRGLPNARVVVQGTTLGATAGVDGRYTLARVPAGTRAVVVSLLGYGTKTVTGVAVPAGAAVNVDVSLSAEALSLGGIEVTATRERGSISRAIDEQRTATGIVNATTTEQIARSPDGDAAQAVQRVSGVTVQDGRYVFVRGLGERYTTTSLNGARIPSPEPERKVVPLDLFPSNLLEAITTAKTFTPDQPGDFSGAQVNLKTRSFPAERTFTFALAGGYNGAATGRDGLFFPGGGSMWLGREAGARGLPATVAAAGDFSGVDTPEETNAIVRSFRNEWSPREQSGPPNLSASASVGGEDPLFGHRIGYLGSFTYARSQDARLDEVRARAVPAADGTPQTRDEFRGATGTTGVLWGGLLNLSTFVGEDHKLELNSSYNHTADGEAHEDWGTLEEFPSYDSIRRTSLKYVERTVRSNQLRGEHVLGPLALDWSGTLSHVSRGEPDRANLAYGYELSPTGERLPLAWLGGLGDATRRTFAALEEDVRSADVNLALPFGPASAEGRLKVGGAFRATRRDADARAYTIRSLGLTNEQRRLSPEEVFDGRYAQGSDAYLRVEPNTAGGRYAADDDVTAGYAMAEYLIGDRVKVIGGARVERWALDLSAEPTAGGVYAIERRNTDVLPSLAVNVRLTDDQNLRLSATRTLSRPEYRELVPFSSRDLVGDQEFFGDSSLVRTRVQNFDARWEWYPTSGEVLSVGLFAKRFDAPIEQIEVATTGATQLSYTNAESASNYGVELEVRKDLGTLAAALEPFAVFTNATLMKSTIHTGDDGLSAATRGDRPMVGQAPYVVNAGFTFTPDEEGRTSATVLYNVVGKRIVAAAQTPLTKDSYEMPRHMLDVSLRFPLRGGVSAKVDAENLFDARHEVKQGSVLRQSWRTGRTVAIGITWRQ
jgi:hypothetical protein